MAEWKKYDETEFTDFGSVGETMPALDGDFGGLNAFGNGDTTLPADGTDLGEFGSEIGTIPDIPSGVPTDGWTEQGIETTFDDPMVKNEAGQTVRPLTGWLVCIEGVTRGVDYRIYSGYSYIGRDPSQNQVAIPDPRISSVPSARILYDLTTRKFYINESNGARNPVYLNDELFDGRVELKPYDIIKLGTTKLLFVPLCTEKFAWGAEE